MNLLIPKVRDKITILEDIRYPIELNNNLYFTKDMNIPDIPSGTEFIFDSMRLVKRGKDTIDLQPKFSAVYISILFDIYWNDIIPKRINRINESINKYSNNRSWYVSELKDLNDKNLQMEIAERCSSNKLRFYLSDIESVNINYTKRIK
jgi:hypothetical protein